MKPWKPTLPPFREHKPKAFARASIVSSFIYQIGESPILRKPSTEVPISQITSQEMKAKIRYLKSCLIKYRKLTGLGRGIAAVQVGIPERFSVIYTKQPQLGKKFTGSVSFKDLMIIINPGVTRKSTEKLIYPEGCMSASPIIAPTIRPSWTEFDYYDEKGKLNHWDMKANTKMGKMMNRVFQHEIDHMEGIINIDLCKSSDLFLESDPKFYSTATFKKV